MLFVCYYCFFCCLIVLLMLVIVGVLFLIVVFVFVQESKDNVIDLVCIEVIGFNICCIDVEIVLLVQVISKQDIQNMGVCMLLQVFDNLLVVCLVQQDVCLLFIGFDGVLQVNLCGFGVQGMLVLLNGCCLLYYGVLVGFQIQFVNIDVILVVVIECMEVLIDGVLVVYGIDVVVGVINVIIKCNFQGVEISFINDIFLCIDFYGECQVSIIVGFGDLVENCFNIYGVVNMYCCDVILLSDFYDKWFDQYYVNNLNYFNNLCLGVGSKLGEFNLGIYFVFDLVIGCCVQEVVLGCRNVLISEVVGLCCVWEIWMNNEIDVGVKFECNIVYFNGIFLVGDSIEIFVEVIYIDIDLCVNGGMLCIYGIIIGNLISWFLCNIGNIVNQFLYLFLGLNNEYNYVSLQLKVMMGGVVGLNYLLQDVGLNYFGQCNMDKSYCVLVGVCGNVGDWNWEIVFVSVGIYFIIYQMINVNIKGFEKVFGLYMIDLGIGWVIIFDYLVYKFGEISEVNVVLICEVFLIFDIQLWICLYILDGKIEGLLFQLLVGEMCVVFGFNVSCEIFYILGNVDVVNGLIIQQGGLWFDGKCNIYVLFVEIVVLIIDKLELDVVVCVDKYLNFSVNIVLKIGFKYQVFDQLMLCGIYFIGFCVLSLVEFGNGGVFVQFGGFCDELCCGEINVIVNLLLKLQWLGDVDFGKILLNVDCSCIVVCMIQLNKDLKLEKVKIVIFGFVYELVSWLLVLVDYWFIYCNNEIVVLDYCCMEDIILMLCLLIIDSDCVNLVQLVVMCVDLVSGVSCLLVLLGYLVGNVVSVVGQYKNRGKMLIDGFDIDVCSCFLLGDWGNLNIGLVVIIVNCNCFYMDVENGWYYGDVVGYYNNLCLCVMFNVDWIYKQVIISMFVNYVGGIKWVIDQIDEESNNKEICIGGYLVLQKSKCDGVLLWWIVNMSVIWCLDDVWNLSFIVKNLFNCLLFYDLNSFLGDFSDYVIIFGCGYSVIIGYWFK